MTDLDQLGWSLRRLFKIAFPEDVGQKLQQAISEPLIDGRDVDAEAVEALLDDIEAAAERRVGAR